MREITIHVLPGRDYGTEVFINSELAYKTHHHKTTEYENLSKLFRMLKLDNVIVTNREKIPHEQRRKEKTS